MVQTSPFKVDGSYSFPSFFRTDNTNVQLLSFNSSAETLSISPISPHFCRYYRNSLISLFVFLLYLNFHLVQGMNQCPRMKHSEIYPAGLQFEAFSFILPLEFGTFVWTSIIFNSGIFTFSKSKSCSSKNWETTAAVWASR